MKKIIRLLMLSLFVICALAFVTACDDNVPPTPTPPATPEYTITFMVNGVPTQITVKEGVTPVFEGSTDKPEDTSGYYVFKGWDKEIAPATEDTTYTAQYELTKWVTYQVRFIYKVDGGSTRTILEYIRQGETPAPQGYATQYITNSEIATFTGWSLPLEPLTKEFFDEHKTGSALIYNATYSTEERLYDVNFTSDGELLYTASVPYMAIPEYKGEEIKIPDGYNYLSWIGLTPVNRSDMNLELIFTYGDPTQLEWAYAVNPISFSPTGKNDNDGSVMQEASAVLYMILEVRNTPDDTYSKRYRDKALESLRYMVSDEGDAPFFDLEPYWCYVPLSAAITLCKETPSLWVRLSSEDREKYDIVMRSFAYILTLGTADENSYLTGPGLQGNFGKSWNPNYRLANVTPMLFVGKYFGGAANVNTLLKSFSFDEAIADFAAHACFERAYARWTTVPKDENGNLLINPSTNEPFPTAKNFMEDGGWAYIFKLDSRLGYTGEGQLAGYGAGVRVNYAYGGYTVDNVREIMAKLIEYTFSGGKVWSDSKALGADGIYPETAAPHLVGTSKAYILDGTISPVEGLDGLMLEFNSGDGGSKINGVPSEEINGTNIRSSATYNLHNFMMLASSISALESLGLYDCDSDENKTSFDLMWVGLTDFLYKYEHGYMSFSLGKPSESKEGSKNDGYYAWKHWWRVNYADKKSLN